MKPESLNISMVRPHLHEVPSASPLPSGYNLRTLGLSDEPQLAALLGEAFGEPWDERRVGATLTRTAEVKAVYGVLYRETLVATASSQFLPESDPQAGFVHWVATHPHHRGQGLAAALLERLLEDFRARGYKRARLVTQPERSPAVRTYLKFGFLPEYEVDGRDHRRIWSEIFQALGASAPRGERLR